MTPSGVGKCSYLPPFFLVFFSLRAVLWTDYVGFRIILVIIRHWTVLVEQDVIDNELLTH
jgi:hypothetical protein